MTAAEGNSTFTITNVQQSDVGNYHCLAINSQGIVYSSDAALQMTISMTAIHIAINYQLINSILKVIINIKKIPL